MPDLLGGPPATWLVVDQPTLDEALKGAALHDRIVIAEGAFPDREPVLGKGPERWFLSWKLKAGEAPRHVFNSGSVNFSSCASTTIVGFVIY